MSKFKVGQKVFTIDDNLMLVEHTITKIVTKELYFVSGKNHVISEEDILSTGKYTRSKKVNLRLVAKLPNAVYTSFNKENDGDLSEFEIDVTLHIFENAWQIKFPKSSMVKIDWSDEQTNIVTIKKFIKLCNVNRQQLTDLLISSNTTSNDEELLQLVDHFIIYREVI